MSHLVTIATQVRDPVAIGAACQRLKLPAPVHGRTKLFSAEATGWAVQLPRWKFPIVCDTNAGTVHFDNYNGRWGEQRELDRLMQAYAVEKTRITARQQGHTITEQQLADGSVKLTIQVGETA